VSFIHSLSSRFTIVGRGTDTHWTGDWVCPEWMWTPSGLVPRLSDRPPRVIFTILKVEIGQYLIYKSMTDGSCMPYVDWYGI
jgi:hypothetical protein